MAQPPTRQALLQHVFEETVHVAGRLLPDTVEFLQQHDCRTVVILSANDTDSLLCVHVLQSCLSERLGLLVKLYVAACYADLLLASVRFRQESAVVIFINCCARIYIGDLFTDQEVHNEGENAQGDNRGRGMRDREMRNDQGYQNRRSGDKLLCLVDYHRPYDPEYVSNSLEQMAGRRKAASGLATNAVHIYLTEADYSRLKVQVYDKKEAGSFEKSTSDHDTNSISTIVDIMSLDLGEYVADDTSYAICYEALVETGILDSVETSSRPTQPDLFGYYAAMSLSFHVLQGHYTYRQYLSQINEIRRIMKCNLQEEINLPLLRFQSLKNTAEFSILHIGARLIYDNLNALRTELEINSQCWEEVPSVDTIEKSRGRMESVFGRYLSYPEYPTANFILPMVLMKTAHGVLSSMDLALLLTLHIVPSLHEDRSVDRLVQKEMSSVVGMQRQRLEVLEEQLACSVDVNGRFLEALAVLDWLRRPADLAPMVGALLRAALGRSDTVQREAVGVVRRLLMRRRTPSDGIVGVKNTLEGFIEEHAHEIIARCPFTMQRVADTLSRILSGGAPEESRPHIILAVIPPVTSEDKAVLIGYLPCASKTRPNRLGIGLQHILRDRLGCDAVSHNGFASYIVRVRGESGRKAFQLLFPRKRSRRSSQQGRRGKRPKQRENSDPQADGNSSQGEVGKQADEIRDAVF